MEKYLPLDLLEFMLKAGIGEMGFQGIEYIPDFFEGMDPLPGIIGQKGYEAFEKLFLIHREVY